MFASIADRKWSDAALYTLFTSFAVTVVLALLDGVIHYRTGSFYNGTPAEMMVGTWIVDLRYVAENAMLPAAVIFVGAKLLETRTIFTIGFNKLDSAKVKVKGPDENNVVWVGHAYANNLEAEAVSGAIAERLKQSAAKD